MVAKNLMMRHYANTHSSLSFDVEKMQAAIQSWRIRDDSLVLMASGTSG